MPTAENQRSMIASLTRVRALSSVIIDEVKAAGSAAHSRPSASKREKEGASFIPGDGRRVCGHWNAVLSFVARKRLRLHSLE
jgi:hypothetical protein